jgi:hypothetical protein
MILKPAYTLATGLALILATNAIVLAGIAYNRTGEPEAQLQLTEREFSTPYSWGFGRENSGLDLQLQWRVLPVESAVRPGVLDYGYGGYDSGAGWLDQKKLVELGFDPSPPARAQERYYDDRALPRDVLLVLELDGPAYREALARAERNAKPDGSSQRYIDDARNRHSRLFVVDAGLDRDALRAKFPDRARYAIVHGRIRLTWQSDRSATRVVGRVTELSVARLNVPLELRPVIAPAAAFEATVPFGRRLEPWLAAAKARPNKPAAR